MVNNVFTKYAKKANANGTKEVLSVLQNGDWRQIGRAPPEKRRYNTPKSITNTF